jgi:hypothetical protein
VGQDEVFFTCKPGFPVLVKKKMAVKVDEIGVPCQEQAWCNTKRCGNHAADHDTKVKPACLLLQPEGLGQATGVIKLDIYVIIQLSKFLQITPVTT